MFRSDRGDREYVQNFLVIITDGKSDDLKATWREATYTRQQEIHIMAVGIGPRVSEVELRTMTSGVNGHSIHLVANYLLLDGVVSTLVDGLCNSKSKVK